MNGYWFSSAMVWCRRKEIVEMSFCTAVHALSTRTGCLWPKQSEEEASRSSRLLLASGCAFTTAQGLRKWRKGFVRVLRASAKRWDFGINKQQHWRVLPKLDYNQGFEGGKKTALFEEYLWKGLLYCWGWLIVKMQVILQEWQKCGASHSKQKREGQGEHVALRPCQSINSSLPTEVGRALKGLE